MGILKTSTFSSKFLKVGSNLAGIVIISSHTLLYPEYVTVLRNQQGLIMLRNFFTIMMTFVITMNITMASPHSGIKDAFDEFHYSMMVDGAALNPVDSEKAIQVLTEKFLALEASGLSREEIIDEALAQVTDKNSAAQLKDALEQIKVSQMSPEQAQRFLINTTEMSYQKGASWSVVGDVLMIAGGFALMLGLAMALLYVGARSSNCPTNYSEADCQQWNDKVKW